MPIRQPTGTSDTRPLADRKILVTGVASGLGGACVRGLAEAGAALMVQHLPADGVGLDRVLRDARKTAAALRVFAMDPSLDAHGSAAERLVAACSNAFGRLDTLVARYRVDRVDSDDPVGAAADQLAVPFRFARAAAAAMAEGGAGMILFIAEPQRHSAGREAHYAARQLVHRSVLEAVVAGLARDLEADAVRVQGLFAGAATVDATLATAIALIERSDDLLNGRVITPDPGAGAAVMRAMLSSVTAQVRPARSS